MLGLNHKRLQCRKSVKNVMVGTYGMACGSRNGARRTPSTVAALCDTEPPPPPSSATHRVPVLTELVGV